MKFRDWFEQTTLGIEDAYVSENLWYWIDMFDAEMSPAEAHKKFLSEFKPYYFWVKSSKMTDIRQKVYISADVLEDALEDEVRIWAEEVFPMFNYTDARVWYGWEAVGPGDT